MKILFLNAPTLQHFGILGQIHPPLGILYLASYFQARSNLFEMKALDGYREKNIEKIVQKIVDFGPDILSVSMTTPSSTFLL